MLHQTLITMENENAFKNFDDLVFENRNKQYGAYAIRRSYNDNVNKAAVIALLSSGLLVIFAIAISSGKEDLPEIIDGFKEKITKIDIVPPIEPITKPQRAQPVRRQNTIPTTVTTDPVPDQIIKPVEPLTNNGSDTGDTEIFPTEGVVTDEPPVVETVPVIKDPVVNYAAIMPQFVGGHKEMTKYIQRTFHYPSIARRQIIEGIVVVSFVVNAEGNVVNVKVEKGISKECDEEAKRIIAAMPKWLPGKQGDRTVSVRQYLPIKFQLNFD
jgi:protein TonB